MTTITTKYLGPTVTKGSRVKASDGDGHQIILPLYGAAATEATHGRAALALVSQNGWTGALLGGTLFRGGVLVGMAWNWEGGPRIESPEV